MGLTTDNTMNWDTHCRQVLTVALQRLHCMHVMRGAGASAQLLRTLYCALIPSAISYAFPAWCNVASTRLMSFVKLESCICRIFDITQNFLQSQCENLAKAALHPQHPLHVIFDCAVTRYSSRLGAKIIDGSLLEQLVLKSALLNLHDCIPVLIFSLYVLTAI